MRTRSKRATGRKLVRRAATKARSNRQTRTTRSVVPKKRRMSKSAARVATSAKCLDNAIDFAVIIGVEEGCPPRGVDDNKPRTFSDGRGFITDVAMKHLIRNTILSQHRGDNGLNIFYQYGPAQIDNCSNLKERMLQSLGLSKLPDQDFLDTKGIPELCTQYWDIRAFGALLLLSSKDKGKKKDENDDGEAENSVSVRITGPVTLRKATKSLEPINIIEVPITKGVNADQSKKSASKHAKSSDTMGGSICYVEHGTYIMYGSIQPSVLGEKTGFSRADAEVLKNALIHLFEHNVSTARPSGSMYVHKVIWWEHPNKTPKYSPKTVFDSLEVRNDGTYKLRKLSGLKADEFDGF